MEKPPLEYLTLLASLDLSPREEEVLAADLAEMLAYFNRLSSLDTTGIEPSTGPLEIMDTSHHDTPTTCPEKSYTKINAPCMEQDYFRVPTIIDPEGEE